MAATVLVCGGEKNWTIFKDTDNNLISILIFYSHLSLGLTSGLSPSDFKDTYKNYLLPMFTE